jgi:hypothetical protein
MIKNILRAMHTEKGSYAISIILGLGIASLFRKICNGRNCIVFKSPDIEEVTSNTYQHDGKCYQFKEKSVKCGSAKRQISVS